MPSLAETGLRGQFPGGMRKLAKLFGVLLLAVAIASILILKPKFDNMASEYGTAAAISDIAGYLRNHQGKWPASPAELGYPATPGKKDPVIDYSLDSKRILANPGLLDTAVRPRDGRFYTYPHHRRDLDGLLEVLRETNPSGP